MGSLGTSKPVLVTILGADLLKEKLSLEQALLAAAAQGQAAFAIWRTQVQIFKQTDLRTAMIPTCAWLVSETFFLSG